MMVVRTPSLMIVVVMGGPRGQLNFRVIASDVITKAAQAEARSRPCVRMSGLLGMIWGRLRKTGSLSFRILDEGIIAGNCIIRKTFASIRCPRLYWRLRQLFVEADLSSVEASLAVVKLCAR